MRIKIKEINDFESKYDCKIILCNTNHIPELRIIKTMNDIKLSMSVCLNSSTSEKHIIYGFNDLIDKIKTNQEAYNFVCGSVDRDEKLEKIMNNI